MSGKKPPAKIRKSVIYKIWYTKEFLLCFVKQTEKASKQKLLRVWPTADIGIYKIVIYGHKFEATANKFSYTIDFVWHGSKFENLFLKCSIWI